MSVSGQEGTHEHGDYADVLRDRGPQALLRAHSETDRQSVAPASSPVKALSFTSETLVPRSRLGLLAGSRTGS
jgi:hypothetical protein